MQCFVDGYRSRDGKRRCVEQSEETLFGLSLRFLVRWNALAKDASRPIADVSQSRMRGEGSRQYEKTSDQALFSVVSNSGGHKMSLESERSELVYC